MRRTTSLAAIALVLVLGATACGGGDDSTSAVDTAASAAPRDTAAPTDTAEPTETAAVELTGAADLVERATAPRTTYVGQVEGSNAYVAIVEQASGVVAYLCDSDTIGLWFNGEAGTGSLDLTHQSGARLTAEKTATGYDGTVTLDGQPLTFTTAEASHPAGLWEGFAFAGAEDPAAAGRFGWIVLPRRHAARRDRQQDRHRRRGNAQHRHGNGDRHEQSDHSCRVHTDAARREHVR